MRGFSLSEACRAAGFAYAAYEPAPRVVAPLQVGGSLVTVFFGGRTPAPTLLAERRCSCFALDEQYSRAAFIENEQTGTQAEVWTGSSSASVLSFRGTEISDLRDVATDIFFTQSQVGCELCGLAAADGALVHSGFGRAFASVREAVLDVLTRVGVLDEAGGPGRSPELLLTGHSLGGALALLAARELGMTLGRSLSIITFGAPRVGNTQLALELYRATAQCNGPWRVVNYDDYLVPRFPRGTPANRIWDYVHAGATVVLPPADESETIVRISAVGDARGCPLKEINPRYVGFALMANIFEWRSTNVPAFVIGEIKALARLIKRGGVRGHFMVSYDEALSRCLAAGPDLRVVEVEVDPEGLSASLVRTLTAPAELRYEDLLRATWEE